MFLILLFYQVENWWKFVLIYFVFVCLQNEWDLYDDLELQMMPGFDRTVAKNGKYTTAIFQKQSVNNLSLDR